MDHAELVARIEIADVLARYARAADRGDMAALRECYHDDAYDDHGPYKGGVDGFVEFVEGIYPGFGATSHHLGHQVIVVDGARARCETSCLCWYRKVDRSGTERSIVQGLRYLDEMERRGARWAIQRRTVILDWEELLSPGPPTSISPLWQRGSRDGSDASFRHFRFGQ